METMNFWVVILKKKVDKCSKRVSRDNQVFRPAGLYHFARSFSKINSQRGKNMVQQKFLTFVLYFVCIYRAGRRAPRGLPPTHTRNHCHGWQSSYCPDSMARFLRHNIKGFWSIQSHRHVIFCNYPASDKLSGISANLTGIVGQTAYI